VRDVNEKRRDFRLMCFAASLALLVLLATPWLTTWNDRLVKPPQIYSGISLLDLLYGTDSPIGSLGPWLFRVYLLLALVCLVFPATIGAVAGSCAGFTVTVLIIIAKPASSPASPGIEHVDWSGAPTVAVGIWLVAVCVSVAGWSTRPEPTVRTAD
jgi:4-amino-4-deoxy-L-arabinose transferase-like glycosyltransferase